MIKMLTIEQYIAIWCGVVLLISLISMRAERKRHVNEIKRLKERLDLAEANRDLYEADARHYYEAWKKEKELAAAKRGQAQKKKDSVVIIPEKII